MTCSLCTTRILRTLATDLAIPTTTTTTTSTRTITSRRLKPSRFSIRYTSSSASRPQNVDLSTPPAEPNPDFLNLYNTAKASRKEALSTWSSAWKPETDLSSVRGGSMNADTSQDPAANAEADPDAESSIEYLDEFTALQENDSFTVSPLPRRDFKSRKNYELFDSFESPTVAPTIYENLHHMPVDMKRRFPTRASPAAPTPQSIESSEAVGGMGGMGGSSVDDGVPWEDPDSINEKLAKPHDPVKNAYQEWTTAKLWSNKLVLNHYKPKQQKSKPTSSSTGEAKLRPDISRTYSEDTYRKNLNNQKGGSPAYRKDVPEWQVHKEAVRGKLGGDKWKPFSRLSPAAVATLKQLKAENKGMTVEEYAPIFKISPDAMRRILKSKWTPTAKEEEDRLERWKRRGDSIWKKWADEGLVETKEGKLQKRREAAVKEIREREGEGFVLSKRLNLKNRIL
ncbi:hypothetical protein AA313_de0200707 [Arthrobotrys entomopaga]|nr:hypothetical protein AA313_de0200707 [Arthrobotrys entomopaga]